MGKITDRKGRRYGKLTAIELAPSRTTGRNVRWRCRCDCGRETIVDSDKLASGNTKSCGCWAAVAIGIRAKTHGRTRSSAYWTWNSMKQRCLNPRARGYRYYGARGVTICDRWATFENFLADMGEPPVGQSLDRIDVNGPYSPDNCRWATTVEQVRNRRNTRYVVFNGERTTIGALSDMFDVNYKLLHRRIADGWSVERAVILDHRTPPSRDTAA